jgi:hypothetical protein
MIETFDLALYNLTFESAETKPTGETVVVGWPVGVDSPTEVLRAWIVRLN